MIDLSSSGNLPQDELQARLAAIVATSDDAIVSKDLNGVIQSWNKSAERIFGYTAEEIIGKPIMILLPPDRHNEEIQILERLRRGERVDHFETERIRKDGKRIHISVTISPIQNSAGQIVGASKIARDITAFKQLIKEREELLQSEQAARVEAERSSRMKDEFLAMLSHELRTPLNAIMGWAQLLNSQTPSPEDLIEGLQTIQRNAEAQNQLVDELLDMSRIITGKIRLDVQRLDLSSVISNSIESIRPAAEAKSIRLIKILDPKAGPIMGDPSRLQQVVWNLLTNAVKFTPRGGHVQVFLQRIDSHIEITISDTGQGIRPDFIPQLFTRFAQSDAVTIRRHGGLGLGLAIVRHLIELHGGTVRASSAGEGKGATFVVALPLTVAHEQPVEPQGVHPAARKSSMQYHVDLSGVKVLVVDDEPDARRLLTRVLEASHAQVISAESAQQGFDLLRQHRPHIVLSDIGMPEQDGYHFIRIVRSLSSQEGGDTPAVALTAFARSEDRQRALLAGYHMHLPKPVEAPELLAVVASLSGVSRRGFNPADDKRK
jgi:PAS domain S-box-containing protein